MRVAEAMLKNYDCESLAADIEHQTLKEKRGVNVLCAQTGKWVAGMIKTVDASGVLVGGDRPGRTGRLRASTSRGLRQEAV